MIANLEAEDAATPFNFQRQYPNGCGLPKVAAALLIKENIYDNQKERQGER